MIYLTTVHEEMQRLHGSKITHNLGTTNVYITIRDKAKPYDAYEKYITVLDENTVQIEGYDFRKHMVLIDSSNGSYAIK